MASLFSLIVIIVLASTVSSIAKAAFGYRARRLPGVDRDTLQRLEAGMSELRDQLSAVREDVTELYERVDFTERVLAQKRESDWAAGQLLQPNDGAPDGLTA